jgi:hypothetical protein
MSDGKCKKTSNTHDETPNPPRKEKKTTFVEDGKAWIRVMAIEMDLPVQARARKMMKKCLLTNALDAGYQGATGEGSYDW